MSYCEKCGKELHTEKFCPDCGTPNPYYNSFFDDMRVDDDTYTGNVCEDDDAYTGNVCEDDYAYTGNVCEDDYAYTGNVCVDDDDWLNDNAYKQERSWIDDLDPSDYSWIDEVYKPKSERRNPDKSGETEKRSAEAYKPERETERTPKPVGENSGKADDKKGGKHKNSGNGLLSAFMVLCIMAILVYAGVRYYLAENPNQPADTPVLAETGIGTEDGNQDAENAAAETGSGIYFTGEHAMGNSCQNISEGGFMMARGGKLYYSNYYDGGKLYCRDADGNAAQLTDFGACYLSVWDGRIWFAGDSTTARPLYSMNPDTGEYVVVIVEGVYEPKIVDGWIYYNDTTDGWTLYRVRTDGTDRQKLVDAQAYFCCFIGDTIYYLDNTDGRKGYYISLDGGTPGAWNDSAIDSMDTWEGKLYYTLNNEPGIYCWDPADGTETMISPLNATSINLADGTIRFSNTDDSAEVYGEICSLDLQGNSFSVLVQTNARLINVWNGTVYYQAIDEGDNCFYQVAIGGGEPARLE